MLNLFQHLEILKWIRQAHHPEFTEGQVQDDNEVIILIYCCPRR